MPSFRKFGRIFLNYKQVELILAEVVHVGKNYSYKRQIDAVDKRLVEETIQTVTDAVSGSVLQSGLSVDQKEKTKKICITSMPHVSVEDPISHSTLYGMDENNQPVWAAHATLDPSKQQPARNTNRTNVFP